MDKTKFRIIQDGNGKYRIQFCHPIEWNYHCSIEYVTLESAKEQMKYQIDKRVKASKSKDIVMIMETE